MKRIIICFLLFAFVGHVSAVASAKCSGNTLVYYDLSNTLVKRDCSILHSGGGQIFRGICKEYEGGADCWRTDGTVTSEYRDIVRGYTYNSSVSPWGDPYTPTTTTIVGVTTTTLRLFDITQCPKCDVCTVCEDCKPFKDIVSSANYSLSVCESNYAVCTSRVSKMVFKDVYDTQRATYEVKINTMSSEIAFQTKEIDRLTKNASLYYYLALGACVVVIFIIGVWVKYEWIGDPKVKGGLDVK